MAVIHFDTEDGVSLEGELRHPEGAPRGTAVVCHPDPKYGGSKDHPVLWAVRNELAGNRGLVVLGFNFRGVMGSGGRHAYGEEEPRDVAAAVDRVRQEAIGPTALVGWSFGANVALRYALGDDRIAALALIAVPLAESSEVVPPLPASYDGFTVPTLLVGGDQDPISPVGELRALAGRIPGASVLVVEGTDHFFGRREREPAEAVGRFVEGIFQTS